MRQESRRHVLIDIGVLINGFGIEFQSKTPRSTEASRLTVICEAPVKSVGGWSKKGDIGHAKVGDRSHVWLADVLRRRSEGTCGDSSEVC